MDGLRIRSVYTGNGAAKEVPGYMPVESKNVEAFQASGFECHKIIGS